MVSIGRLPDAPHDLGTDLLAMHEGSAASTSPLHLSGIWSRAEAPFLACGIGVRQAVERFRALSCTSPPCQPPTALVGRFVASGQADAAGFSKHSEN